MIEIIHVLSSWPFAALCLGVVIIIAFKSTIQTKLSQILHVNGPWVNVGFDKADAQSAGQNEQENRPQLPEPKILRSTRPPDNTIYTPLEQNLLRSLEQDYNSDIALQRDWAIRMWAAAAVERSHEAAYRLIFGSQIAALNALNQRGPIDVSEGIRLFNDAVAADPSFYDGSNFSFETWAGFLRNAGLIETSSTNLAPGTKAAITPTGRDFLVWMAARAVNPEKRG
ncbi:hypothetical protein LJR009_001574 [Bosea sp. LjRoot9]|uniref:hypothetical protein n=1 Tax=Bosea sp. LjRoot9 TaxID=3342341 RepID=UPI003ECE37C8